VVDEHLYSYMYMQCSDERTNTRKCICTRISINVFQNLSVLLIVLRSASSICNRLLQTKKEGAFKSISASVLLLMRLGATHVCKREGGGSHTHTYLEAGRLGENLELVRNACIKFALAEDAITDHVFQLGLNRRPEHAVGRTLMMSDRSHKALWHVPTHKSLLDSSWHISITSGMGLSAISQG